MNGCPKCNAAMIRADLYEPEGTIPLHGGYMKDGYWWVCTAGDCDDGYKNVQNVYRPFNTPLGRVTTFL